MSMHNRVVQNQQQCIRSHHPSPPPTPTYTCAHTHTHTHTHTQGTDLHCTNNANFLFFPRLQIRTCVAPCPDNADLVCGYQDNSANVVEWCNAGSFTGPKYNKKMESMAWCDVSVSKGKRGNLGCVCERGVLVWGEGGGERGTRELVS